MITPPDGLQAGALSASRVGLFLGLAALLATARPAPGPAADLGTVDISDGCTSAECHGPMLERPVLHAIVEAEECDACHEPKADRHVFEPMDDPPDLCWNCHDEFPDDQFTHMIVEAGECLACHDPHGSDAPKMLMAPPTAELCVECHDNPAEEFAYPHGPARDGRCLDCHHPHYAKHEKLLDLEDGDLCLSCHSKTQRRKDGSTVANIGELLSTARIVHGPVNFNECLVCHGPHGGVSTPTLRYAFPPGFYGPFSEDAYLLCFQCHDAAMVTEEQTTETAFRDGTRNLHFVHVNRAKGRSCRICHNPHGSTMAHMLKASIPFGKWKFSLRYKETRTGGSCGPGCHQRFSYERLEALP